MDREPGIPAVPARVSDADRQQAIDRLREACGVGRLTLDEFSDRAALALACSSRAQLDRLVADLPVQTATRLQRGVRSSVALFGSNRKRVRWRICNRARAVAIGGACWLDLRRATIEGDEVLVTALAFFGTVKVIVPEGVGVELSGVPVFGAKTDQSEDRNRVPSAPVVRVRGFPSSDRYGSSTIPNRTSPLRRANYERTSFGRIWAFLSASCRRTPQAAPDQTG